LSTEEIGSDTVLSYKENYGLAFLWEHCGLFYGFLFLLGAGYWLLVQIRELSSVMPKNIGPMFDGGKKKKGIIGPVIF
jgi:hypothetical protein